MARIVLVHGAFHELWGPHELKARWLPALRDGLWHHGASVTDDDVAVCFYGDLFRHDPETAPSPALTAARAEVSEAFEGLPGGDLLGALSQAADAAVVQRTVDMVATMVAAPDLAEQVRARFDAVVTDDTAVVVAHSLGSVIAYRALANADPASCPPVHTLVTLGSPLGSPLVFDTLKPAPVNGVGVWPGRVQRWVNVAAVGDQAASVDRLSERFGARVEDRRVDNGHRAHDPEPYLNNPITGEAVACALIA